MALVQCAETFLQIRVDIQTCCQPLMKSKSRDEIEYGAPAARGCNSRREIDFHYLFNSRLQFYDFYNVYDSLMEF